MLGRLGARLAQEWRMKIWMSLLLPAAFCTVYFTLQRHPMFPLRQLPVTWLDEHIPFDVGWVYAYQSLYLLTPLPWLARSSDELRRYAVGFALLSIASFACFVAMPAAAPRPDVPAVGLYGTLVGYDTPLNTFPSLHVGLAAYTALFATRPLALPRTICLALAAWATVIAWAALGLKQHFFVDLPPALVLAWAAHRIALRSTSERRP